MSFRGKICVITGASSGIGFATALELARAGADLVLAARRVEQLELLAAECRRLGSRVVIAPTDVTVVEQCQALIRRAEETFGQIDLLVNNAGFAVLDRVEETSLVDAQAMMQTNFFGMVHCVQAALPGMLQRSEGSIVNIASICGIMGYAGMSAYCASKFAVVGFSEALRDEVIAKGVNVSVICPGTTGETEFFTRAFEGKIPAASRLALAIPARRVARAVMRAVRGRRARIILPPIAFAFLRFKEFSPRTAHLVIRHTSTLLERIRN